MKIVIEIPSEFETHFEQDRFEDSLHRLSADAHLLAGNYEQEVLSMLIKAFKDCSVIKVSEDAISREDAVNALIAHFIPQTYTGEQVEQASKLARKIMANAPSVIPKAKEGEWIPCSERLPKDNGHYICSFVQPQRIDKIHIGLAYCDNGRWVGYNAREITAWMPLPKPWKGAANE